MTIQDEVVPISLLCELGKKVYWKGSEVGVTTRWVDLDQVAVRLHLPIMTHPTASSFGFGHQVTDTILLTTYQLRNGDWSVGE